MYVVLFRNVGLATPGRWFKAKMKKILKTEEPDGFDEFKCSNGWLGGFLSRHIICLRVATNNKPKSAAERVPALQKFHSTSLTFRQPPPLRDEKYGRFPADATYASDQVRKSWCEKN